MAVAGLILASVTLSASDPRIARCSDGRLTVDLEAADPYADSFWTALPQPGWDSDGAIFEIEGTRYFHPVATAQLAIEELRLENIAAARSLADTLVRNSTVEGDARLSPYGFEWTWADQEMLPPWYSGMAQGQVVSVFARLFEATREERYLDLARAFHRGLLSHGMRHEGHDFFVEEYPVPDPDPVLNGWIFGIFGMWDLLRVSHQGLGELCGTAETLIRYAEAFRVPGQWSWYDLEHRQVADPIYHHIHTFQLRTLAEILGSEELANLSLDLELDYVSASGSE